MSALAQGIIVILAWGAIATFIMASILFTAQSLGWSRLNMPYLLGAFFTGDRSEANVLGFLLYVLGGWLFAFLYYLLFSVVGTANVWVGAIAGFVHALLLLVLALPTLSYVHPRMASEFEGPDAQKILEPPGFLGLHYGFRTPLVVLVAQTSYGVILGIGFARLFAH